MPTYEAFNAKVEQRKNTAIAQRRTATYKTLAKILLPVLAALLLIAVLEAVNFIHPAFAVILGAIALTTGSFNLGRIWRTLRF